MSDDEADPELLALLRASLNSPPLHPPKPSTRVLRSAEHIYNNSTSVALSRSATLSAASSIHSLMNQKSYSPAT